MKSLRKNLSVFHTKKKVVNMSVITKVIKLATSLTNILKNKTNKSDIDVTRVLTFRMTVHCYNPYV